MPATNPGPPPLARPVGTSVKSGKRYRWLSLLVLFPCVGAVLGLLVAVISAYITPKKYESVAAIQVHRPGLVLSPVPGREGELITEASGGERFMETEFEVIRAAETLKRVIDRLDLPTRWNGMEPDRVVEALQAMLHIEQIPGTDLVKIRVRHANGQEARDIADALMHAYRERRIEMERGRADKALNALDTEVRKQEDLVEEKRKLFHTIVKVVGIPYIEGVPDSGVMGRDEEAILRKVLREEATLDAERNSLELEIKTILRLKNEELLHYLVLSERAPGLKAKLQAFNAKANELEVQRTQLAEGDPKLSALEKELELLQSELHTNVTRYQEKLQIDLQLLDGRLQKLKETVGERRDDAVDKSLQSQDYVEAKSDYEAAKQMLLDMKNQHSMQRIALKIPKDSITIHEEPTIARRPSSPKVDGLLLGGTLIGAAAGLLLALPIAALMVARG